MRADRRPPARGSPGRHRPRGTPAPRQPCARARTSDDIHANARGEDACQTRYTHIACHLVSQIATLQHNLVMRCGNMEDRFCERARELKTSERWVCERCSFSLQENACFSQGGPGTDFTGKGRKLTEQGRQATATSHRTEICHVVRRRSPTSPPLGNLQNWLSLNWSSQIVFSPTRFANATPM